MTTIFVAKLDFGVTENELLSLFQQYGTVAKVTVAKDKETNKSRGFAFVEMPDAGQAKEAISALDGYAFNGRKCVIKEADERPNNRENRGGEQQRFQRDNKEGGNFRPRTDYSKDREQKPFQKPQSTERPIRSNSFTPPHADDEDAPESLPKVIIPQIKKKKDVDKPKTFDDTADGKSKKQKMNAYKKSGKDLLQIDDDDLDDEFDLFGRDEDDELDDDYSQYLVNQGEDDEEEWEDDEEWDDDEEWEDDED